MTLVDLCDSNLTGKGQREEWSKDRIQIWDVHIERR